MDVGVWLRGLGLEQYEALFRENDIDAEVLSDLTDGDLEKIGVSLGHRKRLLKAAAALAAGPAPTPPAAAAPVPACAPPDAAERRQLTVMFSDLVGSTALSARLDPEDMRQVIRAYQDTVSGVVARYDGFTAKFMGDGVLAYFGFPRAHEDDAVRAVHAGLEITDAVAALQTRAREKLAARVGIATGLVVVGDLVGQGSSQEQAVVGDTPNLAARLQGLAEAGGVVVSASTRRLVGDRFRLRDLGKHAVKGLTVPVEAFAALGVSASESRFEAAHAARLAGFVGREAESARLLERQRRAWGGQGQIVLISGEAGIGKSRLSAWLAEQVAETPHTRLRYQCSPYHRDSALYPFVQQFERASGIAPQEPPEAKLEKLEQVLGLATDRMNEVAPLIASMLSIPLGDRYPRQNLSPAQQRRQTLSALLDQMEGLAKQRPVLMLFEDAHWADATSLEVLDLAIERVRRLPVLMLVTSRPEFEAPWKGLPDVAEIALSRFDRAEAETLVERVTAGRKLPAEVLTQIVAKTDGVPLFVEELTKNVLESGLLIEEGERYRLDRPLPPLAIPSTLQDSLMARLDRLAAVKEIAQIGAAIAREFSYPLLHAVVGRDEATLRASLAQLEDSELVFRHGTPPDARYSFKHALVQDTAYESLLKSRRQILHQKIAETLREIFPDVVAAEPELLAHHFTQAGLTAPAIEYWGKAGDLALRRSAFKEAIAHLGKAIEMTEALAGETERPGGKLKLQVSYGNAMILARGHGARETSAAFERARDTATDAEDGSDSLAAQYGLWAGSFVRGELGAMRELSVAILRNCSRRPQSGEASVAHRISGVTHWFAGEFVAASDHLEQALASFDSERDGDLAFRFGQDPGVVAMAYSAQVLWLLGEVRLADQRMKEMTARAAKSGHAATAAYGLFMAAELELIRRNPDDAAPFARSLIEIAHEHQLVFWMTYSIWFDGWLKWRLDNRDAGLSGMRNSRERRADQGIISSSPFFETILAEAEVEAGQTEVALATINHALAESERMGQRWYDAELHRTRGEILLKQNAADSAPAEQAFLTAIAIAQHQKARSFELRAALSLARLYQSTDRPAGANAVLGRALEGFAPTPEFPEISEAQATFDALGQTDAVKAAAASRKQRIQLQVSYGNALIAARGYGAPETTAAFLRARNSAAAVKDAPERFSVIYGVWVGSYLRGELADAREYAATFLSEVGAKPGQSEAGVAWRVAGITSLVAGEFVEAAIISSGRWRYSIPSATPIKLFVSGMIPASGPWSIWR
ncbi:MAG TPA: adenylate/guanylate cyclase domain-containing protein [Roseiarcus sp.]|nr:adenylate/guanylate cyclase domain-containing protein [Roseiarcus sp.]